MLEFSLSQWVLAGMPNLIFNYKNLKMLEQTQLFEETLVLNEIDEYSRKRISVHKVAKHLPKEEGIKGYSYYLIIHDAAMTLNIELSEASIINLLNAVKK